MWDCAPCALPHRKEGAGEGQVAVVPQSLQFSLGEPSMCTPMCTPNTGHPVACPSHWQVRRLKCGGGGSPQSHPPGLPALCCPLLSTLGHCSLTAPGTKLPLRNSVHSRLHLQGPDSLSDVGREMSGSLRGQPQSPPAPCLPHLQGTASLGQSPARPSLPLGHQVVHSQGTQGILTAMGQPTCSPPHKRPRLP